MKKLIALISVDGKSNKQLFSEVKIALKKYKKVEKKLKK